MPAGADGLPDASQIETFASGLSGPVDLKVGPDGALYYVGFDDGRVHRITVGPSAVATGRSDRRSRSPDAGYGSGKASRGGVPGRPDAYRPNIPPTTAAPSDRNQIVPQNTRKTTKPMRTTMTALNVSE